MRKAYSVLVLTLLIVILFSIYYVKIQLHSESPENTLVKCFNYSGAKIVSSEIYFRGRIHDGKYDSIDELKKLSADIMNELKGDSEGEVITKIVSNDFIQEVGLSSSLSNKKSVNVISQIRNSGEDREERSISVSILHELSKDDMESTRKTVIAAMKRYGIDTHVNSCIIGSFEGRLTNKQMNDISKLIFKGANARKVEGMRDKNLISISAYSPVIDEYIRVGDNRINLNLAIRYNSYEDRTYIWLATPVISTEY